MEASALRHASRRGLLARRSPLLRLQGDDKLVALVRDGNAGAFDAIVERYQPRLLGFCRQMLGSTEDAEDVLQEVFVNAFRAMRADNREINLRPWLYRIARNRCLNHLRKPTADGQDSMDMVPIPDAASTHERVYNREEFRELLSDVSRLPETQRSALLLREMDAMSYEDIAQSMDTTVPSVKSLLVRARISLAEASQARRLTCGEVQLELAEAAEGLRRVSAPARRHVRDCEQCGEFRAQVRSDAKALAALAPVGPLIALKSFLASKLGLGGGGAGAAGAGGAASGVGGAGTIGAGAGTIGAGAGAASGAAGGLGVVGSAIGVKAVAGVVTAAVITAGAVEVKRHVGGHSVAESAALTPKIVESGARAPLATAGQPQLVIRTETAVPTETEAATEAPVSPSEPVAPTTDPATAPVGPTTTVPAEPVTDPAAPPESSDGIASETATLATGPVPPYQGGAITTVGDPQSHPSQTPPGFSDPPSSSWNDPGGQPSGDPPTAEQPSPDPSGR